MTEWHEPRLPRSVAVAIPFTEDGTTFIHKRSMTVRSARGVWSFPTGLQEVGETLEQTAVRELAEEWSLTPTRARLIDTYYTIAEDEPRNGPQYHWNMHLIGCLIDELPGTLENREPDKHEQVLICGLAELATVRLFMTHTFTRSFDDYGRRRGAYLVGRLQGMTAG